jgi:S1-C subfamily serine protease
VIMAVDGQELDAENNLADLIAGYAPGDAVTLEIERPDAEEPFEVAVELGEHPDQEGVAYLGVRYSSAPRVRDLQALPFAFPEGKVEQGAIVQRVNEDSPASAAGLKEGDVIMAIDGEAVESPQALADAIAEREPGDSITLTVYQHDGEEEREIEITLAENPDDEGRAYLGVLVGGFFRLERHFGGDEQPFDFDFDFELPLDKLPFDLDELPEHFEFQWPPEEDDLREDPGWPGDNI